MPPSPEPEFALDALIAARLSRRGAIAGAGAAALLASLGRIGDAHTTESSLDFEELAARLGVDHDIAAGHRADVLIAWGDPVLPDAPPFTPDRPSVAAQERQFGYGNDYLAYFPLPHPDGEAGSDRGLLFVNHEATVPELMFKTYHSGESTLAECEVQLAAHGLSVVEVAREGGLWSVRADSSYNRRLPSNRTVFELRGPAAGHPRLCTRDDPSGTRVIGTLNNCAGGRTPWGTALSGEENVHHYFHLPRAPDADGQWEDSAPAVSPLVRERTNHARLGIGPAPYPFFQHIPRFHVEREPHEPNRFGWVVELDPYDPEAVPVKRTALGRFCHEGAETTLDPDGRVVVYMGDDGRGEYVYRFVSANSAHPKDRAANRNLLDEGTLFAARFFADGTLRWLPLVFGVGPLTPANGFESQADVLIETRRAADLVGATRMDRPEDVEASPTTGSVFVVLTNNSRRGRETGLDVDAANPRRENRTGHILELRPPRRADKPDHSADVFSWDVFLLGGDPARADSGARIGAGTSADGWLSCPDNIAFDRRGRLWIATDGHVDASGRPDGLWACDTDGAGRAATRRFYAVPMGAELCGPCFTPDGTTLFVAVQHPGEGSTYGAPSTRWPDFDPERPPRPAVVALQRLDGGPIGG